MADPMTDSPVPRDRPSSGDSLAPLDEMLPTGSGGVAVNRALPAVSPVGASGVPDVSESDFVAWFVKNYPPDTIITNPAWHAPRIWRQAEHVAGGVQGVPTREPETRRKRRPRRDLPPLGDVYEHPCFDCGESGMIAVREKQKARWGESPEVEIEVELYRCQKCAEGGVYTFEQSQASARTLWLATIEAHRAEDAALRAQLTEARRVQQEWSALAREAVLDRDNAERAEAQARASLAIVEAWKARNLAHVIDYCRVAFLLTPGAEDGDPIDSEAVLKAAAEVAPLRASLARVQQERDRLTAEVVAWENGVVEFARKHTPDALPQMEALVARDRAARAASPSPDTTAENRDG